MNKIVNDALQLWGMSGAVVELIAARENAVYRVVHRDAAYALRLHRKGYRTDAQLRSELAWMDVASKGGITVPAPIASMTGAFLHVVEGIQVDVLTWLPGAPLSTPGGPLTDSDRTGTFRKLGHEMARLHDISDAWTLPAGFERPAWDRDGLLGETPLWDRFWDNPGLSAENRALFTQFRARADADLKQLESTLDFGLIHADLVSANVMVHDGHVALIDFDDGGFGFRLFEIATALLKQMTQPDYTDLRDALISGYRSVRAIDIDNLDLFLALRATTYVGWNITRMDEDGAEGRNIRFIDPARELAHSYLTGKS